MDSQNEDRKVRSEDMWIVLENFFSENNLVRQQLESFNEFIQNTIQDIIDVIETSKDIIYYIGAENLSINHKSGYVIFYPTSETIEQPQFSGQFIYDGYEIT